MRSTKIVCTIGPASREPETIDALVRAGMDVARLNLAHGTHDEHGRSVAALRAAAAGAGHPLALLADLAGPKVRVGALPTGTLDLEPGQRLTLAPEGDVAEGVVPVTYGALGRDVRPGDTLLLSDGLLELSVDEVHGDRVVTTVAVGGPLSSFKGINVPTRSLSAPILSEKDLRDLEFALGQGVDFIAVSFVRAASDVETVRNAIEERDGDASIVAKIEKHEALAEISGIVESADAVMIARGDLGVEIPLESVPLVQKSLTRACNEAGKPVITATQMLRSMVENARPTRAEVTDVANAILDGSDAVMLSEETAIGERPAAAVRTMARIAEHTESGFPHETWPARYGGVREVGVEESVARAACAMAEETGAAAIATFTESGSTTRRVAKYRPGRPVLALTANERTYRAMALVWGAIPLMTGEPADPEEMILRAAVLARESGLAAPGETVIVTAGLPIHVRGTTNLIRVVRVPGGGTA